jgi:hypothetical protein
MPRATLTDEGYQALAAMAAEGQDQASVANAFGMNRFTLQALIKRDQRAENAMNVGKALLADEFIPPSRASAMICDNAGLSTRHPGLPIYSCQSTSRSWLKSYAAC